MGLPCRVCEEPAAGWVYLPSDWDGVRTIEAYAVCVQHQNVTVVSMPELAFEPSRPQVATSRRPALRSLLH